MNRSNPTLGIAIAVLLAFTPLAAIATTQQQINTQEAAEETKNIIKSSVDTVNDVDIDTRWSPSGKVEADNGVALMLVECPPGDVPENPQYTLAEFVSILQSVRVGLDEETLAWMMIVQNYGEKAQWVNLGVDCAEARDDDDDGDDDDDDTDIVTNIDVRNIFKFINKNIVINKNVTVIGNGTSGNGSVTVPPPSSENTTTPEIDPPTNTTETEIETPVESNTTTTESAALITTEEEEEEEQETEETETETEEEEEEETEPFTPENSETTNGELTDDNDNTAEGT